MSITNLPFLFCECQGLFNHIQASDVWALMLKPLIDKRLCESFNTVFVRLRLRELPLWGGKKKKNSTLSYWASGLVGCVLTIWVTSQWNIFSLKKLSAVFSDQYRLCSDMPVSFNMLLAESPRWASNLLILAQTEWLQCWTQLRPWWMVQNRTWLIFEVI